MESRYKWKAFIAVVTVGLGEKCQRSNFFTDALVSIYIYFYYTHCQIISVTTGHRSAFFFYKKTKYHKYNHNLLIKKKKRRVSVQGAAVLLMRFSFSMSHSHPHPHHYPIPYVSQGTPPIVTQSFSTHKAVY